MSFALPPVVKQAERLLVEVEQAARKFPRAHKYTYGADLRRQAMEVTKLAHRAWRDPAHKMAWLGKLKWSVDDLKLTLQLGSRIRAFSSFGQFEEIARVASQLGRQVGGWHKQQSRNRQNGRPGAASQRAMILSTPDASEFEAKP